MQATLSFLQGSAGPLALHEWPLPPTPVRATVLIVHGLGEHAGRYGHVAAQLRDWGFAVRAYDHQGHGQSAGARGRLHSADGLMQDLDTVIEHLLASAGAAQRPLVLLGHSMGGLLVARAVACSRHRVDAVVMSSPAFGIHASGVQKGLLALMPRLLPQLTLSNGLDPRFVARDPAVVQAYRADPLVHDRISAALGGWIWREGPKVLEQAAQWSTPALLVYAGTDRLVDPAACDRFAARASAQWVSAQRFEAMYHEVFNDPEREQVFALLRRWLDARFSV
jgi:alpha-beta hydrolase superfamily lysophospholipase